MSTSRILLFGVAAITLLFAGSVVIIDGVSRRPAAMILAPVQAMETSAATRPATPPTQPTPPPWIQGRREAVPAAAPQASTPPMATNAPVQRASAPAGQRARAQRHDHAAASKTVTF